MVLIGVIAKASIELVTMVLIEMIATLLIA